MFQNWEESSFPTLSCYIFTFLSTPLASSVSPLYSNMLSFFGEIMTTHHCMPFFVSRYHLSSVEQKECNLKYIDFFLQIDKISIGYCFSFFFSAKSSLCQKRGICLHSKINPTVGGPKLHMSFHPPPPDINTEDDQTRRKI